VATLDRSCPIAICSRRLSLLSPVGKVVAGGQGVGVVWAEDALSVGEELLEFGDCLGGVSGFRSPVGDVVAGAQGVGVVWAEDALSVGEELLEFGDRSGGVSGFRS
jgi:hypothetical protein